MRTIHVEPLWPDSDAWLGNGLDQSHYTECVRDEAVVLKNDGSGGVLFRVLRNRIPFGVCKRAFPALCTARQDAANRIEASGHAKPGENGISDVMGFMDGTERYGNIDCRETAWSAEHFLEQHSEAMPLVNTVDDVFHEEMPGRWIIQRREMLKTHAAWRLSKVFTTVTINLNMRTHAHRDPGDLKEGFGVVTVIKAGAFTGGELIFPRWGIAVDVGSTDVLLCDVHELHGNAPFVGEEGKFLRVACVYYFRTGILACGSPAEESNRVEDREMERVHKRVAARKLKQPAADQAAVTVDPAPDPSRRIEALPWQEMVVLPPPPPRPPHRRLTMTEDEEVM